MCRARYAASASCKLGLLQHTAACPLSSIAASFSLPRIPDGRSPSALARCALCGAGPMFIVATPIRHLNVKMDNSGASPCTFSRIRRCHRQNRVRIAAELRQNAQTADVSSLFWGVQWVLGGSVTCWCQSHASTSHVLSPVTCWCQSCAAPPGPVVGRTFLIFRCSPRPRSAPVPATRYRN